MCARGRFCLTTTHFCGLPCKTPHFQPPMSLTLVRKLTRWLAMQSRCLWQFLKSGGNPATMFFFAKSLCHCPCAQKLLMWRCPRDDQVLGVRRVLSYLESSSRIFSQIVLIAFDEIKCVSEYLYSERLLGSLQYSCSCERQNVRGKDKISESFKWLTLSQGQR